MDKNIIKGNWKQAKGKIKQFWGELTDNEIDEVKGNIDDLVGILQKKYGYTRDKAKKEVREKLSDLKDKIQ
ncbi:MAG: CsbD family protein [Bacteriovoracaceae bacterium]|nr:CsbD family protein [Bacteriovoracaceae bacterium]